MHLQRGHRREADRAHQHSGCGQPARAVTVRVDAGDRGGHQHPQRERDQLDTGGDRGLALGALEVEDEQEHQREPRQPVQEGGCGRRGEQAVGEQRQVEHRRAGAALDQHPCRQQHDGGRESCDHDRVVPAADSPPRETPSTRPVSPITKARGARARHNRARRLVLRARAGSARPRRRRRARAGR